MCLSVQLVRPRVTFEKVDDDANRKRIQVTRVISSVVDGSVGDAQLAIQLTGLGRFRVDTASKGKQKTTY